MGLYLLLIRCVLASYLSRANVFLWKDRFYFVSLVHLRVRTYDDNKILLTLFAERRKISVKINDIFELRYLIWKVKRRRARRRERFAHAFTRSRIYNSQSLLLMVFCSDIAYGCAQKFIKIFPHNLLKSFDFYRLTVWIDFKLACACLARISTQLGTVKKLKIKWHI